MKKTLVQYTSLIIEIKELNEEILKEQKKKQTYEKDSVRGSNAEFPYQPINFTIEGVVPIDTSRKEKILSRRKYKCEHLKLEIEQFISEIPDSLTRRVFRYRYIDCLSWQTIAMRIGKYDESYARKIIHDRYLEGNKIKIDYAYHITVDGEVIFLGSKLEVIEEDKAAREGTLERIGPSGIYVQYSGLKNATFINFRKIESIKLISENS